MKRRNELEELRREIERLQEAKRRALAIAGKRAKENAQLRQQIAQLQAPPAPEIANADEQQGPPHWRTWQGAVLDAGQRDAASPSPARKGETIDQAYREWRKTVVDHPEQGEIYGAGYVAGWNAKEAQSPAGTVRTARKATSAGAEVDARRVGRQA
jgi:hypothetical protein